MTCRETDGGSQRIPLLTKKERTIMKQYTFAVPCSLEYEVFAETEEEARKILEKGVYPNGKECSRSDIFCDISDYERASLLEEEEL